MFVYMQNFSYLCRVKKKHADIDRMVMESHYLESLERESSPSLSDMERQDYIGRYTIDNLEAERTVRPITRARKSSLHHSSEDGLQMALAYMTIIETAKRLGHEIKDFLVRAWREAIYGNNDLEALLQPAIATK